MMLPASTPASAQDGSMSAQTSGSGQPHRGMHEAMRMVPARAVLDRALSADKTKDGYEFRAKLAQNVQLHNGPELPEGTTLVGKVVKDDMNVSGASKLALRFTHAELKDGQVLPIKATVVGVFHGETEGPEGFPVSPGDQIPNSWNDGTLAVDQIGVMSGIDLHSKISSRNSGVFVAKDKKNMTIPANSEIALAIAAQHHGMHGMKGMGMSGKSCN
jgi:hypothetical protein